ncbi:hypothetical protein BTM153_14560 [Helicobacter pylori]
MAVRFGVIFITDKDLGLSLSLIMVFTNESEFKKLLASVSQLR